MAMDNQTRRELLEHVRFEALGAITDLRSELVERGREVPAKRRTFSQAFDDGCKRFDKLVAYLDDELAKEAIDSPIPNSGDCQSDCDCVCHP